MSKDFDENNPVGKMAEEIVYAEIFVPTYSIPEIRDVRLIPEFQEMDVDYVCGNAVSSAFVEIKGDRVMYRTHNFFIEYLIKYIVNTKYKKAGTEAKGWICTTKADIIYYVDLVTGIIYSFAPNDIKEYIREEYHKRNDSFPERYCDDKYARRYGYLVDHREYEKWYLQKYHKPLIKYTVQNKDLLWNI